MADRNVFDGAAGGPVRGRPLPMTLKIFWSVMIVFVVCLVIGLLVWTADPDPEHFVAVASQNGSSVNIKGLSCVSIRSKVGVVVDQEEYSDPKLADAIADILSIKTVLFDADYAACPWDFSIGVVPGADLAVRYNRYFSRYLVSLAICKRMAEGSVNPNNCRSKNIYVFNPRVEPHDLFVVALVGLAKPQSVEWEGFRRKR